VSPITLSRAKGFGLCQLREASRPSAWQRPGDLADVVWAARHRHSGCGPTSPGTL